MQQHSFQCVCPNANEEETSLPRLHENEDPHTVFALAVHIDSYPNHIGSVWVYIAALVDEH